MTSRQLGDVRIDRIVEWDAPIFQPDYFFHDCRPEDIDRLRPWLEPEALDPQSGKMVMPVQSYLLRTRHHCILVDTCIGCDKTDDDVPQWQNRQDDRWLRQLSAAGVAPEAIDYVFCTHLHLDHCGWNTRLQNGRWTPTFPNARYILAASEYAACEAENGPVFRDNVLPVMEAGQVSLVDSDYALDDEVWLSPSPGHTVGHVCVNLASRGCKAVMTGDLMHSPLQLAHPDWSPYFDHDTRLSAGTRQRFLDQHCETDTLVMTAHFPSPSTGRVVAHDQRPFDFCYSSIG